MLRMYFVLMSNIFSRFYNRKHLQISVISVVKHSVQVEHWEFTRKEIIPPDETKEEVEYCIVLHYPHHWKIVNGCLVLYEIYIWLESSLHSIFQL